VVATAVALAAALCAMTSRFSDRTMEDAERHAADLEGLARRSMALADADAEAYGAFLEARRTTGGGPEESVAALLAATDVPLEMAEIGAEVVVAARQLATSGNPNLSGDVQVALHLATAAVAAATHLVRLNLGQLPAEDTDRDRRLARICAAAGMSPR
jgi:formiminotetrahydrofolate cyclodeaminase